MTVTCRDWRASLVVLALMSAACSADPESAKQEYLKSGDRYFQEKKYGEAIVEYRNALQLDAKFGQAHYKLAQAHEALGDVPNAFREMIRAADAMPDDSEVQVRAAGFLLVAGQFDEARARAERALKVNPRSAEAHVVLGNALARSRNFDAALEQLEEAVKIDPASGMGYTTIGAVQASRGNAEEAELAFKRAAEVDARNPMPYMSYASYLWSRGRQPEAEGLFKKALTIDPENALAHRALATFYAGNNRAPEAEPHLRFLADRDKSPDAAHKIGLADYYLAVNRPTDALKVLTEVPGGEGFAAARARAATIEYERQGAAAGNRAIDELLAREPKNAVALITKAQFLFREAKFDQALDYARRAATSDPDSLQAHYLAATINSRSGRNDDAMESFAEVLRLNPRVVAAQVQLSRLKLAAGARSEAVELAREASRTLPDDPNVQLTLVEGLLANREIPEAEAKVNDLLKRFPTVASVNVVAGRVALSKGDLRAARAAFERAQRADPANFDALSGQVGLDIFQKNLSAAKTRVDSRIAAAPKDSRVLALGAGVYGRLGDGKRSEELLLAAIDADDSNLESFLTLAQLYAAQNRLADARRQLEAIVAKRPKKVGAPTMIGMLYEAEGNLTEAKKRYEGVLRIDPSAAVASNNLAYLYAEEETNLDVALNLAQTAKVKLPDSPEVSDTLGWVYLKKGLASLALPQLEHAAQKVPDNGVVQYHLGVALANLGEVDRSRRVLERALSLKIDPASAEQARKIIARL